MKQEDAKRIWNLVNADWHNLPKSEQGKGSKMKIAHAIWAKEFSETPFDEWWNDMITKAMSRTDAVRQASGGIRGRYRDLAMKFDVLPPDEVLNELWGCNGSTISSIRSQLNKKGFVIVAIGNGQYEVKDRPRPVQDTAGIAPLPAIQSEMNGTNVQYNNNLIDVIRQEFAHQNIRINELAQIMADCAQSLNLIAESWR